jgi:hypothetical protein
VDDSGLPSYPQATHKQRACSTTKMRKSKHLIFKDKVRVFTLSTPPTATTKLLLKTEQQV